MVIKDIISEMNQNKSDYSSGNSVKDLLVTEDFYKNYTYNRVCKQCDEADRWSISTFTATKVTDKLTNEVIGYIGASWNDPSTECQEGQDTDLEIYQVEPFEKTIIAYKTVE